MSFRTRIFRWGGPETEAATRIRFTVFVDEQRVPPDEELDEQDITALHVLVSDESGNPVGTGRLFFPEKGVGRIGRLAVLAEARGKGAGHAAINALLREASARGAYRVILNAQENALPFYEKIGFRPTGQPNIESGIPHQMMELVFGFQQ